MEVLCKVCDAVVAGVDDACFYEKGAHLAVKGERMAHVSTRIHEGFTSTQTKLCSAAQMRCTKCKASIGAMLDLGQGKFVAFGNDKVAIRYESVVTRHTKKETWTKVNARYPSVARRERGFLTELAGKRPQAQEAECGTPSPAHCRNTLDKPLTYQDFYWWELLRSSPIVPRPYQWQCFVEAMMQNLIVCIPTGMGKTLIAELVLANYSRLHPLYMVCLIVDRVPLVYQHAESMARNTGLRVLPLCSETSTPITRKKVTKGIPDCVVCTAGSLHELFAADQAKPQQFSCFVFDECHHASKSHRYVDALKAIGAAGGRPRLMGMSASPLKADTQEALYDMRKLFQGAAIFSPPSLPRPSQEIEWRPINESPAERAELQHFLNFSRRVVNTALGLNSYTRNNGTLDTPRLVGDMRGRQSHLKVATEMLNFAELHCMAWLVGVGRTVAEIQAYKCQKTARLLIPEYWDADGGALSSPMLDKVHAVLAQSARSLVFVETKAGARLMRRALEQYDANVPLPCGAVVGQSGLNGMGSREQNRKLTDFREGRLRALISTSVLEEGLDVPTCDRVLMIITRRLTYIRYLQSKGRARSKDSKVMCFFSEDQVGTQEMELDDMSERMHELISSEAMKCKLPSDRSLDIQRHLSQDCVNEVDEHKQRAAENEKRLAQKGEDWQNDAHPHTLTSLGYSTCGEEAPQEFSRTVDACVVMSVAETEDDEQSTVCLSLRDEVMRILPEHSVDAYEGHKQLSSLSHVPHKVCHLLIAGPTDPLPFLKEGTFLYAAPGQRPPSVFFQSVGDSDSASGGELSVESLSIDHEHSDDDNDAGDSSGGFRAEVNRCLAGYVDGSLSEFISEGVLCSEPLPGQAEAASPVAKKPFVCPVTGMQYNDDTGFGARCKAANELFIDRLCIRRQYLLYNCFSDEDGGLMYTMDAQECSEKWLRTVLSLRDPQAAWALWDELLHTDVMQRGRRAPEAGDPSCASASSLRCFLLRKEGELALHFHLRLPDAPKVFAVFSLALKPSHVLNGCSSLVLHLADLPVLTAVGLHSDDECLRYYSEDSMSDDAAAAAAAAAAQGSHDLIREFARNVAYFAAVCPDLHVTLRQPSEQDELAALLRTSTSAEVLRGAVVLKALAAGPAAAAGADGLAHVVNQQATARAARDDKAACGLAGQVPSEIASHLDDQALWWATAVLRTLEGRRLLGNSADRLHALLRAAFEGRHGDVGAGGHGVCCDKHDTELPGTPDGRGLDVRLGFRQRLLALGAGLLGMDAGGCVTGEEAVYVPCSEDAGFVPLLEAVLVRVNRVDWSILNCTEPAYSTDADLRLVFTAVTEVPAAGLPPCRGAPLILLRRAEGAAPVPFPDRFDDGGLSFCAVGSLRGGTLYAEGQHGSLQTTPTTTPPQPSLVVTAESVALRYLRRDVYVMRSSFVRYLLSATGEGAAAYVVAGMDKKLAEALACPEPPAFADGGLQLLATTAAAYAQHRDILAVMGLLRPHADGALAPVDVAVPLQSSVALTAGPNGRVCVPEQVAQPGACVVLLRPLPPGQAFCAERDVAVLHAGAVSMGSVVLSWAGVRDGDAVYATCDPFVVATVRAAQQCALSGAEAEAHTDGWVRLLGLKTLNLCANLWGGVGRFAAGSRLLMPLHELEKLTEVWRQSVGAPPSDADDAAAQQRADDEARAKTDVERVRAAAAAAGAVREEAKAWAEQVHLRYEADVEAVLRRHGGWCHPVHAAAEFLYGRGPVHDAMVALQAKYAAVLRCERLPQSQLLERLRAVCLVGARDPRRFSYGLWGLLAPLEDRSQHASAGDGVFKAIGQSVQKAFEDSAVALFDSVSYWQDCAQGLCDGFHDALDGKPRPSTALVYSLCDATPLFTAEAGAGAPPQAVGLAVWQETDGWSRRGNTAAQRRFLGTISSSLKTELLTGPPEPEDTASGPVLRCGDGTLTYMVSADPFAAQVALFFGVLFRRAPVLYHVYGCFVAWAKTCGLADDGSGSALDAAAPLLSLCELQVVFAAAVEGGEREAFAAAASEFAKRSASSGADSHEYATSQWCTVDAMNVDNVEETAREAFADTAALGAAVYRCFEEVSKSCLARVVPRLALPGMECLLSEAALSALRRSASALAQGLRTRTTFAQALQECLACLAEGDFESAAAAAPFQHAAPAEVAVPLPEMCLKNPKFYARHFAADAGARVSVRPDGKALLVAGQREVVAVKALLKAHVVRQGLQRKSRKAVTGESFVEDASLHLLRGSGDTSDVVSFAAGGDVHGKPTTVVEGVATGARDMGSERKMGAAFASHAMKQISTLDDAFLVDSLQLQLSFGRFYMSNHHDSLQSTRMDLSELSSKVNRSHGRRIQEASRRKFRSGELDAVIVAADAAADAAARRVTADSFEAAPKQEKEEAPQAPGANAKRKPPGKLFLTSFFCPGLPSIGAAQAAFDRLNFKRTWRAEPLWEAAFYLPDGRSVYLELDAARCVVHADKRLRHQRTSWAIGTLLTPSGEAGVATHKTHDIRAQLTTREILDTAEVHRALFGAAVDVFEGGRQAVISVDKDGKAVPSELLPPTVVEGFHYARHVASDDVYETPLEALDAHLSTGSIWTVKNELQKQAFHDVALKARSDEHPLKQWRRKERSSASVKQWLTEAVLWGVKVSEEMQK